MGFLLRGTEQRMTQGLHLALQHELIELRKASWQTEDDNGILTLSYA